LPIIITNVLAVSNAVADNLIYSGVDPKIVYTHYLGLFGLHDSSRRIRTMFRKKFGIDEQEIVLACIAWDNPVKGIDILLEAVKKLFENGFKIHVIIVGVDPHCSSLPEYAVRLGLSKYIHWAGIKDSASRILNAADIYIQPSRSEGLSLSILEAMAIKLPVVGTRVGGVLEAVVHNETGYLADQACPKDLADAIHKILSQPQKWRTMGEAGYQRYLHFFKGEDSIKILTSKYFSI